MRTWMLHLLVAVYLLSYATDEVYVCMGPASEKYHFKKNCRGLSNCSTDVEKVSLKKATQELKRTLCGWED
jgi:hypothetical protein